MRREDSDEVSHLLKPKANKNMRKWHPYQQFYTRPCQQRSPGFEFQIETSADCE